MELAYRHPGAILLHRNFINTILSSSPSGKEVRQYEVAITQQYLYKLQRLKFKDMGAANDTHMQMHLDDELCMRITTKTSPIG